MKIEETSGMERVEKGGVRIYLRVPGHCQDQRGRQRTGCGHKEVRRLRRDAIAWTEAIASCQHQVPQRARAAGWQMATREEGEDPNRLHPDWPMALSQASIGISVLPPRSDDTRSRVDLRVEKPLVLS